MDNPDKLTPTDKAVIWLELADLARIVRNQNNAGKPANPDKPAESAEAIIRREYGGLRTLYRNW